MEADSLLRAGLCHAEIQNSDCVQSTTLMPKSRKLLLAAPQKSVHRANELPPQTRTMVSSRELAVPPTSHTLGQLIQEAPIGEIQKVHKLKDTAHQALAWVYASTLCNQSA